MMNTDPTARRRPRSQGSVLILTMVFLALFATLAIAFSSATGMNLRVADSTRNASQARLVAESGLAYMVGRLRAMELDADAATAPLPAVASRLAAEMNGTPNLGGGTVQFDGSTITLPAIPIADDGRAFSVTIRSAGQGQLEVVCAAAHQDAAKTLGLAVEAREGRSAVFDFGVASRSPIRMTGNARITGVNEPWEASILSATYSDLEAVRLTGNVTIGGDISTSNPNSYVTITGNPSIGGTSSFNEMLEHIHVGVGEVEFPEVDPTIFEPYATTIIDSSTKTNGNVSFENIRIRAGTNPNFSGNVTIRGVVYIESPNTVTFTGNLNLTGVVVTEDAGDGATADNAIRFTGNMSTTGVENLPNQPQFSQLRQMPGSFLLAPGFGVDFSGNFGTVNGAMAADEFRFVGNAGGTVAGPIICYSDTDFSLTGNSHFRIDRSRYDRTPPGFCRPVRLAAVPDSYTEY